MREASGKKSSKAEAKAKEKAVVKTEAATKAAKDSQGCQESDHSRRSRDLVSEINKLAIETVERGMLAIGLLVLEKVFQGILEVATLSQPVQECLDAYTFVLTSACWSHADVLANM